MKPMRGKLRPEEIVARGNQRSTEQQLNFLVEALGRSLLVGCDHPLVVYQSLRRGNICSRQLF